jgi:lipoate-protein ligase A
MRLPRHDTLLRLPVLTPSQALGRDEDLLSRVADTPLQHWWIPSSPAIVVGLGLHHRVADVVDLERCRALGIEVLQRRAGGGAVWLDAHVLCGAICLPIAHVPSDVTESYRWLGDWLASALGGRRVEVAEARADSGGLRDACYGALSPHEVVDAEGRKFVGLAQVRRRHAALFMVGILCDGRDQSPLSQFSRLPADELTRCSVGLSLSPQQAFAAVAAACSTDATPSAP